jgi:CD2 antigen cytoplasmic tail-binding protein 2
MPSKSVRFASGADTAKAPFTKRPRDDTEEDSKPPAKEKPSKRYRPNEDDLDDIDDWKKEEEDGFEEGEDRVLPSERELLEVKRKRRQNRGQGVNAEGGTHIDDITSLATEGIAIEPFDMKQEESDGTGYFDGDTYVFRKNNPNEEPDAWLDTLNDENENGKQSSNLAYVPKAKAKKEPEESLDDWTKEQLYRKILPLVSDTETVAKAVRRYGQLLKQKRGAKNGPNSSTETQNFAKTCLDDLTGASNALLLKGEVDIYDTSRKHILKILPQEPQKSPSATEKQPPAQWEYMGNQDDQTHGPYTTEQMIGWTQAGYFVGAQKVRIRTIREEQLSTKEDLLADLMDDEDDNTANQKKMVKGEWMWSNEVDFTSYLP